MSSIFFIHYRRCDVGSTYVLTFAYDYQVPIQISMYRGLCLSVCLLEFTIVRVICSASFFSTHRCHTPLSTFCRKWNKYVILFSKITKKYSYFIVFFKHNNIGIIFYIGFAFDATTTFNNTSGMSINSTEV